MRDQESEAAAAEYASMSEDNMNTTPPAGVLSETQTADLARSFEEFEKIVGASYWINRVIRIGEEAKGHSHLGPLLRERNLIALTLAKLSSKRTALGPLFRIDSIDSPADYDTWALVAQFNRLYHTLRDKAQHALLRRMQSAFNNLDDMRALEFEWMIAVHLVRRGFAIRFPEQDETGTFDLLAERAGVQTELECKSISEDKGRQILKRDATEMQAILRGELEPIAKNLQGGMVVRVIVPKRLPTDAESRKAMAKLIIEAVLAGRSVSHDGLDVQLQDFNVIGSPFTSPDPEHELVHEFVERQFGIANRDLMIFFSPARRVFLLSLESQRPDNLIRNTFGKIKDASDRQLTGTRAGIVCVKFEAITADELADLGQETGSPSHLRRETSRFLDSRRQSHLICLGFFAEEPALTRIESGVSRGGRSYFFENPESQYYDRDTVVAFGGIGK